MANCHPKTDHLPKQEPKWSNLPTVAIRIPNCFKNQLLAIAYQLDKGEKWSNTTTVTQNIKDLTLEELIQLKGDIEKSIEAYKPQKKRIILREDKIIIYFPYDRDEVKKIKRIEPLGKFNGSDKSWEFSLDAYEEILKLEGYWIDPNLEKAITLYEQKKQEEQEKTAIKANEKAEKIAKKIVNLIKAANLDQHLPCGWSLFNHQKEAVEWLLAHHKNGIHAGGILADDMGLGKTLSALVAAKAMQRTEQCSIFVICPSSLKDNWLREAQKAEVAIEVFSWAKVPPPLDNSKYLIIADEAHYAQNENSARSKKLLALANHENCLGSWLLTGTPIKNGRPINLYPLLLAVNHPIITDKWEYQRRYCNAHHEYIGKKSIWDNSGASHLDELSKKTEDVILRRLKKDCLDLPPKIRIFKPTELTPSKAAEYKAAIAKLIANYKDRVKKGEVDEAAVALVTLNYLRKVGSQYKVNTAVEIATELLEQNQQVIIFTEFVESAKAVYTAIKGTVSCELLLGETPPEERLGIVDRFQSGENKVFIGTIKAGGVGLTLTAASNVILIDRPWTPGDAEQAEDRCYRIGQSETVTAFWVQLGEIDKAIDKLLESKLERIELVLKGKRKTLRGLDSPTELAKELLNLL